MASKERDDNCNTETDEETLAMKKKRSRRVSFVEREVTNVYIFKRDEDYETPPEAKPSSDSSNSELGLDDEAFGFLKDLDDHSGEPKDLSPGEASVDDDEDGVAVRKGFLRPMGSPSPGSSVYGSASSIDEDDFFGPVSAHFINPDRLSDSAASDDCHDVTMDSTAFSMHFRSLARSESEDFKTPTCVSMASEEKTPTQNATFSGPGSSMVLTKARKLFAQASVPNDKVSCGKDSNDMSLVGENPRRYDFDALSPTLDALLAQGREDLPDVSGMDVSKFKSLGMGDYDMHVDNISVASDQMGLVESNPMTPVDDPGMSTPAQLIRGSNAYTKDAAGTSRPKSEYPTITSTSPSGRPSKVLLDAPAQHESEHQRDKLKENSPGNRTYPDQQNQSPLVGSLSSLSAKRRQIFMDSTHSSRQSSIATSPPKQPGSLLSGENIKYGNDAVLSIGKSKPKLSDSSPYGCFPMDGTETSKLRSFDYPTSPFNNVLVENSRDLNQNHPIACLLDNSIDSKKGKSYSTIEMDCDGAVVPVNTKGTEMAHQGEETPILANEGASHPMSIGILSKDKPIKPTTPMSIGSFSKDKPNQSTTPMSIGILSKDKPIKPTSPMSIGSFSKDKPNQSTTPMSIGILSKDKPNKPTTPMSTGILSKDIPNKKTTPTASPLQFTWSGRKQMQGFMMSENITGEKSFPSERESPLATLDNEKSARIADLPDKFDSSPQQRLYQNSLASKLDQGSFSSGLKYQDQFNKTETVGSGRHGESMQIVTGDSHSTAARDALHGRKRTREDVAIDGLNKVLFRIQRTPEVDKSSNLESEHYLGNNNEREKIGHATLLKQWTDIVPKFSVDTEKMLCPVTEKLNIREIGVLEDSLAQLQRVKIYYTLSSEIQSQKSFDQSNIIKQKRVAETRLLLYKLVYEKARLQLKRLKRQRLLKRIQILSSGIQEAQILKVHHTRRLCLLYPSDPQINDGRSDSCPVNFEGKDEVSSDKMTTMRQELEFLDRKIQNLTKSVHAYCKMKGEANSADMIALVKDHLKKRECCRLIRQEFQLWEVGDLKCKNGQKNIVLDHLDLMFQRITVSGSSVPSLKISNNYNETKIVKNFPNMDVCTAFAFVLKTETSNKHSGLRSLAQETQVMSSALQNLLDVIDEVQSARIEISNLIEISFCPRSVEHLDLRLRFVSFNSGANVIMTLDLTCLKWGIYPSEAFPHSLEVQTSMSQKSATQSLAGDIRIGAENLAVGYSRIISLCRCVSQALQSSCDR